MREFKHQYSSTGQHRIVELDNAGFLQVGGDWFSYIQLATFGADNGIIYVAATPYYEGTLQPDVIYEMKPTRFGSEKMLVDASGITVTRG